MFCVAILSLCLVFRSVMVLEVRSDPEVAAEDVVIGTWELLEACRKSPTQYQLISAAL